VSIVLSKIHKQSRLTLVSSFFLERPGVQVSVCGNDAKKVLAEWLISKKASRPYEKICSGGNQDGRSREQKCVRVRVRVRKFYLNGSTTSN